MDVNAVNCHAKPCNPPLMCPSLSVKCYLKCWPDVLYGCLKKIFTVKVFSTQCVFMQFHIVSRLIEEVIIDENVFCYYIPGSVVTSYENKCFMLNSSHTFVHATLTFTVVYPILSSHIDIQPYPGESW